MMPGVQLHEHVTLAGSGELGLSHYLDCHTYLLHDGEECALIDAGGGVQAARLIENLRATIGEMERLRMVLLTHCHGDHAGGIAALRQCRDVPVASSAWEIRMLEEGSDDDLGLVQARFAGTYPPDYSVKRVSGGRVLADGEEFRVGGLTVRAIVTPGHTRGSVCYRVETPAGVLLFSGDTVFWGGLIQLLNTPGSEISEYRRGVQALAGLGIDCLFPGHGMWALEKGQAHIDKMLYYFRRSAVPPMPAFVEKIKS
jgi:glyoxylase-like metal-dependent hydrolase (beta-lactamase superfamily II)